MHTKEWLDNHMIADWRFKVRHLLTIRVALFWIVVSALAGVWSALDGAIPTWLYVTGGILMNVSLGVARMTKQPGVDE